MAFSKHWIFGCCLGLLAHAAHAEPLVPIEIPYDADRVAVWPGLRVVAHDEALTDPERAAARAEQSDAETVDSPDRLHGRGTTPHWARFTLHNPAPSDEQRLLAVESTTQFDMRLFRRDARGAWNHVNSIADASGGRFGGGTSSPVWELHLAPGENTELLLRIEGPSIVRFPVFVYNPIRFAKEQRKIHIFIGIALGSCIFIGVYIGSLRRYLDDRSVPLYLGMLFSDLFGALWLSGFLAELFPALPESVLSQIGFTAYALLFGFGSLHARIYLDSAAWTPRGDRFLQAVGWLWLWISPWFSLAFPVAARILIVWGGTAVALILVAISFLAARRKVLFSEFIAAAWMAYLLVGSYFLIARVFEDPLLWSSSAITLGQATAVAILFGFAMAQRLMRQRDVLLASRQEALIQKESTAVIMRERGLLFAATNHDLRQPLFGVSLFANLLETARTQPEREEHARKLNMALREADDLLVVIQQLSEVNESSHQPTLMTIKLDEILFPLIEEYRGRADYKHLAIRYVPTRISVTTHLPYFQRIVRNVLSNAVRYADPGDRILVGCRRAGGLRLVIVDTGRGMSEGQAKRAFDAFQRFDATSSISDGFGLGLFSTKSMANALGLAVSLTSRKERGTEFAMFIRPAAGDPGHQD